MNKLSMDMNGEIAAISGRCKTELETGLDTSKKTNIKIGSYDHLREYKGYYNFTLQMRNLNAGATTEVRLCSSYDIK